MKLAFTLRPFEELFSKLIQKCVIGVIYFLCLGFEYLGFRFFAAKRADRLGTSDTCFTCFLFGDMTTFLDSVTQTIVAFVLTTDTSVLSIVTTLLVGVGFSLTLYFFLGFFFFGLESPVLL
jgi:hypothetical protein